MKKFFRFHDYSKKMKHNIATFRVTEKKIYGGKMLRMSKASKKRR